MLVKQSVSMPIPECIRCEKDLFGDRAKDSLDLTGDAFLCGECKKPHIEEFVKEIREMETGEPNNDDWLSFDGVKFEGDGEEMEEHIGNPFVSELSDEEVERFSNNG